MRPTDDGHVDGYVLIGDASAEQLAEIWALAPVEGVTVRWKTRMTGAHDALVVVQADDLKSLQDFVIDHIKGSRALRTNTLVGIVIGPMPVKWVRDEARFPIEAFVRIAVRQGMGETALAETAKVDGYIGSALVAGETDLFLELGGQDIETLTRAIMTLQGTDGVQSTITSFAVPDPNEAHVAY